MQHARIQLTLVVLTAFAATNLLLAQVPAPTPQAAAPMAPPPKPTSFQVTGAASFPLGNYATVLANLGWEAQAALIVRRGAFNQLRVEGVYYSTGYDDAASNLTGSAEIYGGGVGVGRATPGGTEFYALAGAFRNAIGACAASTCTEYSETQFGTKFGVSAVLGHGRARPVIDFHWLLTWSEPIASVIALGAGLRF
jgi:hypothetical protein